MTAPPWTSDADPARRRRWYSDDELNAVQVVSTGLEDGSRYIIIAGELLGTVRPRPAGRGWEARRRSGTEAAHIGRGRWPATEEAAVLDLVADVQQSWRAHHGLI